MSDRPHLVVIYTDAGGGHRATAETLRDLLQDDYRVTLVNPYLEVHPELDVFARWTRYDGERIYNELIVGDGRTGLFCLTYYGIILASILLQAPRGRRLLRAYFDRVQPDLVISVLPMLNRVIIDALREPGGGSMAPCAVLMTDWMEMSRGSWYPRGRDYYALCGTEPGLRQLADGKRGARVFPLSGLLIRDGFLAGPPADRGAARQALGLDPSRTTACLLYGGGGNWRMRELALALCDDPPEVQLIFLCGRNEALAEALRAIDWPFPVVIEGYTREVPRYLGVADLFVGKPGPGSASEALALGLTLLLDRPMALPQERALLGWVEQEGLGRAFTTTASFADVVRECCAAGRATPKPHPHSGPGSNRAAEEIHGVVDEMLRLPPP
ncbi:glycosyltransferase family protein [Endothiovibrio diazotrophicus]